MATDITDYIYRVDSQARSTAFLQARFGEAGVRQRQAVSLNPERFSWAVTFTRLGAIALSLSQADALAQILISPDGVLWQSPVDSGALLYLAVDLGVTVNWVSDDHGTVTVSLEREYS